MTAKKLAGFISLFLFCVVTTPTVKSQSVAASQNKDQAVAQLTKEEPPRDGEEWYARAYKLHNSDRHPEAIESFKHAIALGYRKATSMYNIACAYALINDKDNALAWLQRAIDAGFEQWDNLASDSDLDPLRTDPRFKKLRESLPKGDLYVRDEQGYGKRDRLSQANYDYARLEREASQSGEDWARVGARMLMLRDFERAQVALLKGVAYLGGGAENAMYNLACSYSIKGDRQLGLDWLEKAINAGFDDSTKLVADPDIENLRGEPRFKKIQELSRTLSLSQFNDNDSNDSNYSKRRWAPAVKLYETFVREHPNSGRAWFDLAYALHYSSEHARAVEGFERAVQLGYRTPTSMYNVACAQAMLNHRDAAFEWLDKAVAADFDVSGYVADDEDLQNLRSDPRFKRFLEMANEKDKNKQRKDK